MTMKCTEYAIYYISRFPKSEKELTVQLMQKWYFSDEINQTIEMLKAKDYLNDEKFAASYIRSECINKGKPLIAITNKLAEKWIAKHILHNKIKEFEEEINDWIQQRIKKEIAAYKKRWEEWFDIIQKLMRKWYRLGDIKEVIKW